MKLANRAIFLSLKNESERRGRRPPLICFPVHLFACFGKLGERIQDSKQIRQITSTGLGLNCVTSWFFKRLRLEAGLSGACL